MAGYVVHMFHLFHPKIGGGGFVTIMSLDSLGPLLVINGITFFFNINGLGLAFKTGFTGLFSPRSKCFLFLCNLKYISGGISYNPTYNLFLGPPAVSFW